MNLEEYRSLIGGVHERQASSAAVQQPPRSADSEHEAPERPQMFSGGDSAHDGGSQGVRRSPESSRETYSGQEVSVGTVAESNLYGFSRAAELDDLWNWQLKVYWRG